MYDPSVGVWLEEDPNGFVSGDGNLHRYVGNNATNGVDPSGLEEKKEIKGMTLDTPKKTKDGRVIYYQIYGDGEPQVTVTSKNVLGPVEKDKDWDKDVQVFVEELAQPRRSKDTNGKEWKFALIYYEYYEYSDKKGEFGWNLDLSHPPKVDTVELVEGVNRRPGAIQTLQNHSYKAYFPEVGKTKKETDNYQCYSVTYKAKVKPATGDKDASGKDLEGWVFILEPEARKIISDEFNPVEKKKVTTKCIIGLWCKYFSSEEEFDKYINHITTVGRDKVNAKKNETLMHMAPITDVKSEK